jgi:hypothetical protein
MRCAASDEATSPAETQSAYVGGELVKPIRKVGAGAAPLAVSATQKISRGTNEPRFAAVVNNVVVATTARLHVGLT